MSTWAAAESLLNAIFANMRCMMQSLGEDMQLICLLSAILEDIDHHDQQQPSSPSSSSPPSTLFLKEEVSRMLEEADNKLQSNTASFMRSALLMYNMVEDGRLPYKTCSAQSMQDTANFVHTFVQTRVDAAILCTSLASDKQRNIGIARDHCMLLANTLVAMAQEALLSSGASACAISHDVESTTMMHNSNNNIQRKKRGRN